MEEGAIADYGNGVFFPPFGGSHGHAYRGSHAYDGFRNGKGRDSAQGIAPDVAGDHRFGKFLQDALDGCVGVPMGTSLAKLGRSGRQGKGGGKGNPLLRL